MTTKQDTETPIPYGYPLSECVTLYGTRIVIDTATITAGMSPTERAATVERLAHAAAVAVKSEVKK